MKKLALLIACIALLFFNACKVKHKTVVTTDSTTVTTATNSESLHLKDSSTAKFDTSSKKVVKDSSSKSITIKADSGKTLTIHADGSITGASSLTLLSSIGFISSSNFNIFGSKTDVKSEDNIKTGSSKQTTTKETKAKTIDTKRDYTMLIWLAIGGAVIAIIGYLKSRTQKNPKP